MGVPTKIPGSNSPEVSFSEPDPLAGYVHDIPGAIPGAYGNGASNKDRAPAVPFPATGIVDKTSVDFPSEGTPGKTKWGS